MLTASDAADDDQFGYSVAIAGDTMVVGAYVLASDNGAASGSAYVFTRSTGSTWTEQAKLTASDGAAEDRFGESVTIAGDTIVVGAPGDDENGTGSGTAYIFTRTGTSWTEQAKLTASDGAAADVFGNSVAIDGDSMVVGAHLDDVNGITNSGSAYVFLRTGTTWTEQAKLTASDGAAADRFGESVAIAGDTIVVGAHVDDDNGTGSGSGYIFTRTGTAWTEQAKLTASDGAMGDHLEPPLPLQVTQWWWEQVWMMTMVQTVDLFMFSHAQEQLGLSKPNSQLVMVLWVISLETVWPLRVTPLWWEPGMMMMMTMQPQTVGLGLLMFLHAPESHGPKK